MPAALDVSTHQAGATSRVVVAGEIDLDNVERLKLALRDAVANGESIDLDLGRVTFLDSIGLRAIVEAWVAASTKPFAIRRASDHVRRVLDVAGLSETLGAAHSA